MVVERVSHCAGVVRGESGIFGIPKSGRSRSNLSMTEFDPLASTFDGPAPSDGDSIVLLDQARGGDEAALNSLLSRYQDRLRRIVRVRMGPGIGQYLDSMDIVQGTNQVAWRKLASIEVRGSGSILNWLARVAERQIQDAIAHRQAAKRDWRREVNMEGGAESSDGGLGARLEAETTGPPELAERGELPEIIDHALSELIEVQREVIVLRDYCGGDWSEIASTMEKTVPAVRELHRRARIKLAIKLGPILGDEE